MGNGQGEQEKARASTIMSVQTPVSPSEYERDETAPATPRRRRWFSRPPHLPVTAAGAAVLIILTLVLIFADGGRTTASDARITPTATATATATHSPTAAPGFLVYMDSSDGFLIQYPHAWTYSVNRPGIQFVDDTSNLGFVVDVIVLSDTSTAPQGTNPLDGSVWVNHVMRDYASQFQDQFQQLPGPISDAHFGGAAWQSGVALLGNGSSRVRVQVYATVHDGRPFVLAILAADDIFTFGSSQYFQPMLASFRFLPPAA